MPPPYETDASSEPDMRGLGILALVLAVGSALSAVAFFPLAILVGAVAIVLGVLSRGHQRSRGLGTAAVIIGSLAVLAAILIFVSLS